MDSQKSVDCLVFDFENPRTSLCSTFFLQADHFGSSSVSKSISGDLALELLLV